jgi:hypothetical protein
MFEHRVVPVTVGEGRRLDLLELDETLRNEGHKGWELVTVLAHQQLGEGEEAHLLLFKRARTRDVFHGAS